MATMPSNFVLHLPNEILGIIINELAFDTDNDNDNDKILAPLASCRLASHVLCSLATPFFFSSILLTDGYSPDGSDWGCSFFGKRVTKLNDILATGNIAASIHTLTLRCGERTLEDSSSGAIMSAILPRLPHIQKFSLNTLHVSFRSLSMDFAAAIQGLCRSPNITTLYLDGIQDFPFTTIRTSPNLRCLHLWAFSGLAFDDVNDISRSHLLHLESLEVDSDVMVTLGSRISKDVSIAKCFSRLKNLQVKDLYDDGLCWSRGWDVMLPALQTLEKLELAVDHFTEASVPFDLGRFPALRHLKIEQCGWYQYHLTLLPFLAGLLSIPSSPSGIEVVETRISLIDLKVGDVKDLFSYDAGWSTLDEIFTSQIFLSLRKVVLDWELHMTGTVQPHTLELERNLTLSHLNDLFPSFRASNSQRTLEIHLKVRDSSSLM